MSLQSSSDADNISSNNNNNSSSNLLPVGRPLQNDFFALRHGQSQANCLGIIASDPQIACHHYGLSELGQQQARNAGQAIVQQYHHRAEPNHRHRYDGLAVISSDLLRCRETATLVLEEIVKASSEPKIPIYTGAIVFDTRLRERNFGDLEGTSDANYAKVWAVDAIDSTNTTFQVEPVDQVMQRVTALVTEYDALLYNRMIVLTAHGDVLQILQTALASLPGTQHRTLPHLETATLRRLERTEE